MRALAPLGLALPLLLAACGGGNDNPAPLYTTELLTRHDAAGYSGLLTVHDGTCALGDVTAAGTGVTGSAPLAKRTNADGCEWQLEVPYGPAAPAAPPSYTLTITQGGQAHDEPLAASCASSATGFQETFAHPVTPANPSVNPVTIGWTAVQYGSDYLVSLGRDPDAPSDNPFLALPTIVTNGTSLVLQFDPVQLPYASTGFRVFAGPLRWMLHEASSCYSVSGPSPAFTVIGG